MSLLFNVYLSHWFSEHLPTYSTPFPSRVLNALRIKRGKGVDEETNILFGLVCAAMCLISVTWKISYMLGI